MKSFKAIKSSHKKPLHIGLDIGSDQLKLFSSPKGSISNGFCQSFDIEPSEKLESKLEAVGDFLQQNKQLLPSRFSITPSLSFSDVIIRSLRIPKAAPEEVMGLLRWELSETIDFTLESHQLRYIYIGEMKERQGVRDEYLIFLTPNEVTQKYVDFFVKYDLDVSGLDFEGLALARFLKAYGSMTNATNETVGILHVDQTVSSFQILRYGQLAFMKSIKYGARDFDEFYGKLLNKSSTETKQWRLECSAQGDLSEETKGFIQQAQANSADSLKTFISSCLRYFSGNFRGEYVQQIYMTGELSNFHQLNATLSDLTGTIITTPKLEGVELDLSHWAKAIGQSLKPRAQL